jgi:hypothetical protein
VEGELRGALRACCFQDASSWWVRDGRLGWVGWVTVPVVVSERALRDALTLAGEWERDGTQAARAALEWMGWDGTGALRLRRYDVQVFVWYTLPRTFLATLEQRRRAIAMLARTLECVGDRAAIYAEVCRSPETEELLCAWEADDPAAVRRFGELLKRSGVEPPDTDLIAWGQAMGFEEARARDEVATALEEAIEDGRLRIGSAGFRRRQAQVADAALLGPWSGGVAGFSRFDAVRAERFKRWLERGHALGSAERQAILEPVATIVAADPRPVEREAASAALAPALWLLERAEDGIALTQTGALNRAFVREVAERWPEWWRGEGSGPPSGEGDVRPLVELHPLLRLLRLVRRRGRRIVVTARGRRLRDDPPALFEALACELLAGHSFHAACAELAAAVMLDGATIDFSNAIADRIQPAIIADGWHLHGASPSTLDVWQQIIDFARRAQAIGILTHDRRHTRLPPPPFLLTDPGHAALAAALHARALAPATTPG